MQKARGITLIALVVIIVLLFLLSGVSMAVLFGNNGIITKGMEAKERTIIGQYKDKIYLVLQEEGIYRDAEGKDITIATMIDRLKQEEFVADAKKWEYGGPAAMTRTGTTEAGTIRVFTKDGYMFDVILEPSGDMEIIEQGKDDGEPYPSIYIEQIPLEGLANEKIKIKVTAKVEVTKETTRVVKVENLTTKEEKEYIDGGVIFEVTENGTYIFKATTNKNKSKAGKITINITNPQEKINIEAEPKVPTNTNITPITVNITYGETELNNSDRYQYRIGKDGSWQIVKEANTKLSIMDNTLVVARYYDGSNSFKVENYSIQNVDKVLPEEFNYTVTKTTNSITIIGSTTDIASPGAASEVPGIAKYEYSKDNGVTWQEDNIFSNLITGSYMIKMRAIDKAGNIRNGISSSSKEETETVALIPIDNSSINIGASPTIPTNGNIMVNISYIDNGLIRQYKRSTDSSWTDINEMNASFTVAENMTITARYYDGTNTPQAKSYSIQNYDNVAPNNFNYTVAKTTNSITITGSTTDAGSPGEASSNIGIARYEYSKDNGVTWQTSNVFTGLTTGSYTVKMRAIDKAGNIRNGISATSKAESETVGLIPIDNSSISIGASPTAPTNGNITVNINYANNGLTRQYKKSTDSAWTTVSGTSTSFTVTANIAIAARYYDGTNTPETKNYSIQNYDNVAPNRFNYTVAKTTNSITITGSTTDAGSPGEAASNIGIARYEYSKDNGTTWQTSNVFGGLTTGSYTVKMRAIDKAGNIRNGISATSKAESETVGLIPIDNSSINIGASPTAPTNGNITVNISYANNGLTRQYKKSTDSTWTTVSGTSTSFTVAANMTITARYYDGTNTPQAKNYSIQNYDNVAPNSFNYTVARTTNSITITGSTTDAGSPGEAAGNIGIARYEYSKNNGGTWQTSNVFSGLTTGNYTVKMRAIDKAGNIRNGISAVSKSESETVGVIPIDNSSISIGASPTTPTNRNITVNIGYANNGLTRQYKKSTDSAWTTVSGTSTSFTVAANMTIYARYFDGTNSTSGRSYAIQNYDNVKPSTPTVNLNGYTSGAWTRGNVTFTLASTDTGPAGVASSNVGVVNYQYSKGGATWINCGTSLVINTDQNTTYKFRSVDKAGNISNETGIYTVRRDTAVPIVSATSSNVTSNSFRIIVTASDSTSGIAKIEYSNNGGGAYSIGTSNTANYKDFTGLKDGVTYYVRIRVTDNAGNIRYYPSESTNINVVIPVSSVTIASIFQKTREDEAGYDANKLHVGDFISYDAGTWTKAQINSIRVGNIGNEVPASGTRDLSNTNYQFSGFTTGDSRNETKAIGNTATSSGWRIFDVADNGVTTLITAGNPEYYKHPGYKDVNFGAYHTQYILTGIARGVADSSTFTARNWGNYVNSSQYATSATTINKQKLDTWYNRYMGYGSADTWKTATFSSINGKKYENLINNGARYYVATYRDMNSIYQAGASLTAGSGGVNGVRVLVTLRADARVSKTPSTKNVTSNGKTHTYKYWTIQ